MRRRHAMATGGGQVPSPSALLEGLGTDLTDRLHTLLTRSPTAHGMRAAFRTLVSSAMRPTIHEARAAAIARG